MNINLNDKFNSSLVTSKRQSDLIMKKRIQSANFTKYIKNKIFKGYNKIKFVKSKDFNLRLFLSHNPEEKYLPTSEKYNIYYENKYLSKFKNDSKRVNLLLKNSITYLKIKKKKSFRNKSVSFSSKFDYEHDILYRTQRKRKPCLNNIESNKSNFNVNSSRIIFKNKREENAFSKYPFVFFNKLPDNVNNPKGLRNYPYYNPKYKQKNINQQHFLFTISHQKEKKVKNLFRSLSAGTIHKQYNKDENSSNCEKNKNKYNLVSFSCSAKKEKELNINKLINSIKSANLKRYLIKKNTVNFFK